MSAQLHTNERQQWLEQRRRGIGGSEAAAVLGLSPWKSALELYCDKIGLGDPECDEPEYLQWGRILEPVIAERYTATTGRQITDPGDYCLQWSSEFPFMCCTVDRDIWDAAKGHGVLEIKTAAAFKESQWAEEPPTEYQIQMQHNLVVTGRRWGSFAVLLGGQKFVWCDVESNDRFCRYLVEQERAFWDRVERRDPPAPGTPHDSAAAALRRLYPSDTGDSIALSGELIEIAERIERLKASEKALGAELKQAENILKAAIGNATFGVLPNGITYSLKTVKRAGYTVGPQEFRQLRRVKHVNR